MKILALSLLLVITSLCAVSSNNAQEESQSLDLLSKYCEMSEYGCHIRVSIEGDLFVFDADTRMLYVSYQETDRHENYDLSTFFHHRIGMFRIDFVPYSNQNTVIFYVNDGSVQLSRLDLSTGEITAMPQYSAYKRLWQCNQTRWPIVLPPHYIMRLGVGSHLLMCALSEQNTMTLHIVDVLTLDMVQTLDFDINWTGASSSPQWSHLLGGQDGNIYFIDYEPQTFLNNLTVLIPPQGWRFFRYQVDTGAWTVQGVNDELLGFEETIPRVSQPVAVTQDGEIIYWRVFRNLPFDSEDRVSWSLSRYTLDFQLVDRISSGELGGYSTLYGITENVSALFIDAESLSLIIVETNPRLNPTPSP